MSWKKLFTDHSGVGHLKGMAVIIGGAFVVLLVMGQPVSQALLYAAFLACPLMMIGMMFGGHGGHSGNGDEHSHNSDEQPVRGDAVSKSTRVKATPIPSPHDHF